MGNVQPVHTQLQTEAEELLDAIETAEGVIVATIDRECVALRAGHMLAARALHTRLCDAATVYLDATRAARASIRSLEHIIPGSLALLEERRASFSSLLKVELAVLATERAAVGAEFECDFAGQSLGGPAPPPGPPPAPPKPAEAPGRRVARGRKGRIFASELPRVPRRTG